MLAFHKNYFLLALLLLIVEFFIGMYLHDAFIRPYGGDFLVVILLYCLVKSFTSWPLIPVTVGVLVYSYAIEISQYFHLIKLLGLEHSKIAKLLLGTSFSVTDLFCYTLGILTVVLIENVKGSMKKI